MPLLSVLDHTLGDKRIEWLDEDKKEQKKAEKLFNEKKDAKFLAFGYMKGEQNGVLIDKFDPKFDRIVMVEPMAGG